MLENNLVEPATITHSRSSCKVQCAPVDVRNVLLLLRRSIAHRLSYIQFALGLVVTKPQPSMRVIAFSCSMRSIKPDFTCAGLDLVLQNRAPEFGSCSSAGNSGIFRTVSLAGCSSREPVTRGRNPVQKGAMRRSSRVGDGGEGKRALILVSGASVS